MPTCLELADTKYTGEGKAKLMGKSFVSTLKNNLMRVMIFFIFTLEIIGLFARGNGKLFQLEEAMGTL